MKNTLLSILAFTLISNSIVTKAIQPSINFSYDLFDLVDTGNHKAVKKALKNNIDINKLNDQSQTALDVAIEHGHSKIICDLALRGGKVTSVENMRMARKVLRIRAAKFLLIGLAFLPFLAISIFFVPLLIYGAGYPGAPMTVASFLWLNAITTSLLAIPVCSGKGINALYRSQKYPPIHQKLMSTAI